uniref:Uncharacterized protein n=1 Tax=Cucumis sativus TaxID=3659 RepID=A0A0A0L1E3_CUCSA
MTFVVENLQPLGAVGCREAGNDANFTEASNVAVTDDDVTALDEVLVRLRVVEAADDGPHGGDRGIDLLNDGGAALVHGNSVVVVTRHRVRNSGSACLNLALEKLRHGGGVGYAMGGGG